MKKPELSDRYLSGFCEEMALLLQAGITVDDGLETISRDYKDKSGFLACMRNRAQAGASLQECLLQTGQVPQYMLDMVLLGERSGRLEKTLFALADYYDKREKMNARLLHALTYPLVLIIMLAAVVTVLITQVLPIFADVFSQLGTEMSPFARALMGFGQSLTAASAGIIWALAGLCLAATLVFAIPPLRKRVLSFFRSRWGGSGIFRSAVSAQFASAMTTAMASGLDPEESVELAGRVIGGIKKTDAGLEKCRQLMSGGESLEKSLSASGIFSARDSRLLALGVKTGRADAVMEQIAERSRNRAADHIETAMGRIEPTLVVIISLIVGSVLLSVMLPLLGVMSSLG